MVDMKVLSAQGDMSKLHAYTSKLSARASATVIVFAFLSPESSPLRSPTQTSAVNGFLSTAVSR